MPRRRVDVIADVAPGSIADRLRARREAMDAGNAEGASDAFKNPSKPAEPQKVNWDDMPVDKVVGNRKRTER